MSPLAPGSAPTEDPPAFLAERADGILRITFSRPDHGNALPPEAIPALAETFASAETDASVRCILIAGQGKNFSAGGNIQSFAEELEKSPATLAQNFTRRLTAAASMIEAVIGFSRPIVAEVRGAVAGAGLLYTLAADVVIGDESAFFLFAHQRMGLSPDGGVSYLLPRVVGLREAKRLLLTAARVDAGEAKSLGLLTRVVPAHDLSAAAAKQAAQFANAPQRAVRTAKTLLNQSLDTSLRAQLDAETAGIAGCVVDADFAEGVRSFLEKRPTRFPSTAT